MYQLSVEDVLKRYKTTPEGINEKEAKERQIIYGKNKLEVKQKNKMFTRFFKQFTDPMVIILTISGLIAFSLNNIRDAIVLFFIVALNIIISFVQEFKAEKVLDSLKILVKAKAKVMRSGKLIEMNAEDIVPGDIINMEAGDRVPADVRIIEESNFSANDFSLTGESNPVKKFIHAIDREVHLGDRNNLLFMGTTIATGKGKGVIIATGMKTEIGRIADMSRTTSEERSPLQKQLDHVAKKLTLVAGLIGIAIFMAGSFRELSLNESLIFALSVASSIVPQALPTQISIALSLSAGRLSRKKTIIKKLSAVETLGSTHVICTDKTGTLTTNEMTVQEILFGKKRYSVSGVGYEPNGKFFLNENENETENKMEISPEENKFLKPLFLTGIFASTAQISPPDKEHHTWYAIGDPTEAALITLGEKANLNQKKLNETCEELKVFSFDAARKMMTSIRKTPTEKNEAATSAASIISTKSAMSEISTMSTEKTNSSKTPIRAYIKGAPLIILERCTHYLDGAEIKPMTEKHRKFLIAEDENFAKQAYRILAFAYRDLNEYNEKITMTDVEQQMTFIGMAAMMDPPRTEVKDAMAAAKKAYIRIIVITGDFALTAKAIAQKIGLGDETNINVIANKELEKMSDLELLHSLIKENIIFSRTAPEDKLRIVDLLKRAGEIVAVTGDGINDAPALKRADIGVAMGKTGTDVAQESAEIVLMNDSFATLVDAIREGRIIYANLKKTIIGTLMACMGELSIVLLSMFFGFYFDMPLSILAIQILAIDMGGEFLPLTALTWDPGEKNIMTEPPRSPTDYILNKRRLMDIAWTSILMGILTYGNFLLFAPREGFSWKGFSNLDSPLYFQALTLSYVTIVFIQLANILSLRTKQSIFSKYLWSNRRLLISYALSIILVLNVSYNPYLSKLLQTGPLNMSDWLMAIAAAGLFLLIQEIYKKRPRLKEA